jgi:hypothetical protein
MPKKSVRTQTFLIAHTNPNGTGIAQAKVTASSETAATKFFHKTYPGRVISSIGVKVQ